MVRAPSKVTVLLAAKFNEVKSATASAAFGIEPPVQLPEVAHEPPLALDQTPEPGGILMARVAAALVTPLATTV